MTAPGIAPLSGLHGFVIQDPEATPEERSGNAADPRHGAVGETAKPFPYEKFPGQPHGPYGLDNQLLGVEDFAYFTPGGELVQDPTADLTPITHAAPWPKGVPNTRDPRQAQERTEESYDIHSSNMGGWREAAFLPTANPEQADWAEIQAVDPGITLPEMQGLPSQLLAGGSGGWGSRDRTQSYAGQNQYGFDAAHIHRRYVNPGGNSLPGNFMWMRPGARPIVKSIPGTANIPVGYDSPHYGEDPGDPYDIQGAVLMTLPAAYSPPAEPALAQSVPANEGTTDWGLW